MEKCSMSEVYADCQSKLGKYIVETANEIIRDKRDKSFRKISDVNDKLDNHTSRLDYSGQFPK
jgi:hypothetical protein